MHSKYSEDTWGYSSSKIFRHAGSRIWILRMGPLPREPETRFRKEKIQKRDLLLAILTTRIVAQPETWLN